MGGGGRFLGCLHRRRRMFEARAFGRGGELEHLLGVVGHVKLGYRPLDISNAIGYLDLFETIYTCPSCQES